MKSLPGAPDIVLPRYRLVVMVHGCFWHSDSCPEGCRRPATNAAFWQAKLDANVRRDAENIGALRAAGWRAWVVWECRAKRSTALLVRWLDRQRRRQRNGMSLRLIAPER